MNIITDMKTLCNERHKSFIKFCRQNEEDHNCEIICGENKLEFRYVIRDVDNRLCWQKFLVVEEAYAKGESYNLQGINNYYTVNLMSNIVEYDMLMDNGMCFTDVLKIFFEEIPKKICDHGNPTTDLCIQCLMEDSKYLWGVLHIDDDISHEKVFTVKCADKIIDLGYSDFQAGDKRYINTKNPYIDLYIKGWKYAEREKELLDKILELELRPPGEGGVLYKLAEQEFNKHLNI
jgi:hypothetical protein